MKKLLLFAFAAFALAACSDEKYQPEPAPEPFETISFESSEAMSGIDGLPVALGKTTVVTDKNSVEFDHIYWAKAYTVASDLRDDYDQLYFAGPFFATADGGIWFSSYYCDGTIYGYQFDTWGGFVLSTNTNKDIAPSEAGVNNQFEAYADAGAGGSATFAACYDLKSAGMAMNGEDCCWPQIDFTKGAREVISISLANSTWTYNHFKGKVGDSYAVKITGSIGGVETGSVTCKLVLDAEKVSDWKNFDLTSLGEVDCLVFKAVSSDPYAPFYFCADNIVLKNK